MMVKVIFIMTTTTGDDSDITDNDVDDDDDDGDDGGDDDDGAAVHPGVWQRTERVAGRGVRQVRRPCPRGPALHVGTVHSP